MEYFSDERSVYLFFISSNSFDVGSRYCGACAGGLVVKNPPANAGDERGSVSIPESEGSPGGENGNPLQYVCLENSMDRGDWWATVHGVANSRTQLSTHTHTHANHCFIYSVFSEIF